jgi:hypothetical protein
VPDPLPPQPATAADASSKHAKTHDRREGRIQFMMPGRPRFDHDYFF